MPTEKKTKSKAKLNPLKAGELTGRVPGIQIPELTIFKKGEKWAFMLNKVCYTAPLDKKEELEKVLKTGKVKGKRGNILGEHITQIPLQLAHNYKQWTWMRQDK